MNWLFNETAIKIRNEINHFDLFLVAGDIHSNDKKDRYRFL
jgi:hypothetical protein